MVKVMRIQYGNKIIESDPIDTSYIEDLANSQTNKILLQLLESQCREAMAEMLNEMTHGGIMAMIKAKQMAGYIRALEDTIQLISVGLKEALKSTDS